MFLPVIPMRLDPKIFLKSLVKNHILNNSLTLTLIFVRPGQSAKFISELG